MDQHQLVCLLKEKSVELGYTPTRDEFVSGIKGGKDAVNRAGGYSVLIQMAGLLPSRIKPKRIDNSIFEVKLEKHLSAAELPIRKIMEPYPTVAIISDIHWPFSDPFVIAAFLKFIKEHPPQYVILNGDAWDMYSHTKFPRSHNQFTPREEQRICREMNEEFWKSVKSACPKAICYQMMGNHDIRPMKRILEEYPEAEDWVKEKLEALFTYDGVKTIHDPREELILREDLAIFHGYRSQLGSHRDYTHMSCMNGHTHRGGTVFKHIRGVTLFECNSGYAGNPLAKGLTYTPQKITEWTPGFSYLWPWGPQFIPV